MTITVNPPKPKGIIATAQSFGNYNMAKALCDLIDNSIKAQSTLISIQADYNEGDPIIIIQDNGYGMDKKTLKNAMEFASGDIFEDREPEDMGRFGWGLKSASFSQCKKLTVISKKDKKYNCAIWDLEHVLKVNAYEMFEYDEKYLDDLKKLKPKPISLDIPGESGTIILWQKCERLSENGKLKQDDFNAICTKAIEEISLVYNRIISGKSKLYEKLTIKLNGQDISPYDPFFLNNQATMPLPEEKYEDVVFQPYILPHWTKCKESDYEMMEGKDGLIKNQGFYIFRNDRLLIYGTWFGLLPFSSLKQLVRISVDISNKIDIDWKITIDKSDAQIPSQLKNRFLKLIETISKKSVKVYRGKGGTANKSHFNIWERRKKHNEFSYKINDQHPLVKDLTQNNGKVGTLIDIIEMQLPLEDLRCDFLDNRNLNQTETDKDLFKKKIEEEILSIINLLEDVKVSELRDKLRKNDYYKKHWEIIERILADKGI